MIIEKEQQITIISCMCKKAKDNWPWNISILLFPNTNTVTSTFIKTPQKIKHYQNMEF